MVHAADTIPYTLPRFQTGWGEKTECPQDSDVQMALAKNSLAVGLSTEPKNI